MSWGSRRRLWMGVWGKGGQRVNLCTTAVGDRVLAILWPLRGPRIDHRQPERHRSIPVASVDGGLASAHREVRGSLPGMGAGWAIGRSRRPRDPDGPRRDAGG